MAVKPSGPIHAKLLTAEPVTVRSIAPVLSPLHVRLVTAKASVGCELTVTVADPLTVPVHPYVSVIETRVYVRVEAGLTVTV